MNHRLSRLVGSTLTVLAGAGAIHAAELPIPCVAGSCGASAPSFVSSGAATAVSAGNTLRVQQQSDRAILNWKSFNIGPDGKVIFEQPDASSIALNRIFQGSPSKIFGTLQANGQIYLINQNGIVFGAGSQVNTAGLLASTLNMSDDVFNGGILAPGLLTSGKPVLEGQLAHITDDSGHEVLGPDGEPLEIQISVEQGAKIKTSGAGGRVLLASRTVTNAGSIETPDGQVLLAAGEKVYLAPSSDPLLRGLLIEVDPAVLQGGDSPDTPGPGKVWNAPTGEISTPRGNTTLVGFAVNQDGRISATTTVSANGSVRLLARDSVLVDQNQGTIAATRGGQLEIGSQSRISVLPELNDTATAVDDQEQLASTVELSGRQVVLRAGTQIVAPGGNVQVTAVDKPNLGVSGGTYDLDSRIRVEKGALIDVSGSTATLPASRNMVTVELRANELADSPLQRNGALRGQTVVVDRRVGTALADVSGAIAAIPKSVAERTSKGGTVSFNSAGDVVVADGANIDVSGGQINYESGLVQTTQLMRVDGKLVDIGDADPNAKYIAAINPTSILRYNRWGVTETVRGMSTGRIEPGYIEGTDAGTLAFAAPNMVLNGNFTGTVTNGTYQRDAASAPLGGQFLLGVSGFSGGSGTEALDRRAPSINLVSTRPNIVIDSDAALPGPRSLDLDVDFLTSGGFTRTKIQSNGVVTLSESTPLDLLPGATLQIAAQRIDIQSDITSRGGSILFSAEATYGIAGLTLPRTGIDIGAGVTLDVRGLWTNDFAVPGDVAPFGPVYRDGGKISLTVKPALSDQNPSELVLRDGVGLLASGGAWRQSSGALVGGKGGSISLAADRVSSAFEIGDDVALEAFGVNGADGGSFSLSASRLQIQSGTSWAQAQRVDPLAPLDSPAGLLDSESPAPLRDDTLKIGTSLFSDYGFSHFNLSASGQLAGQENPDPFVVTDGSSFDLRVRSLQLGNEHLTRASGGTVAGFSSVVLARDLDRVPVDITMRVAAADAANAAHDGRLKIESGTVFRADPGSSITFSGENGLFFDGQLFAPSGKVTFATPNPSTPAFETGFLPTQRIELGASALVDTSGVALIKPSDADVRIGDVLGGGSIRLLASRGSIAVQAGARLSVAGTSAALDLPLGGSVLTRKVVASAAGTVELRAAESIAFSGQLDAHAGVGDTGTPASGTLSIALTRAPGRGFEQIGPPVGDPFPSDPRVVRILDTPFAAGPGLTNGLALLSTDQIAASGVDALRLESDGRIEFDPGVSLALGRSLTIDSPAVSMPAGGSVMLTAPYVAFGNSVASHPDPITELGGGKLDVHGEQIELIGTTDLLRIGQATFSSSGDLRVRGTTSGNDFVGALRTSGDLTLQAQRIYPSTATSFTLSATGGSDNTISILQAGISPGAPLSAAGSLSIVADNIVQGGTIYAPFGSIRLSASDSLTLMDGSLTSVAATDLLIPFGNVQIGTDWVYGAAEQLQDSIPDRRIELDAPTIVTQKDSKVDLRGGGDLYAYEWAPGTGGHKDALDPSVSPGLYAIIPSLGGQLAPYDPQEFSKSDLQPGDSIYLSGSSGVPAGTYALLPARYALLPGAYLVTAVKGTRDLQPTTSASLSDGSPVVAGYRTFAGTTLGDTRYTGYSVRPGSFARELAAYNDYKASTFFPSRAQRLDLGSVPLTADAGSLGISTDVSLTARGSVLTAAATGGTGASIDVSATRLEVTSTPADATHGIVQLDTNALASWKPAQLLLGGRRSADGESIDVRAESVTFKTGADLALGEIIAVARDEVTIQSGARVASTSANAAQPAKLASDPVSVSLTGEGAAGAVMLAVSDLSRVEVTRADTAPEGAGHITIAEGGELSSRGSLVLDAPGGASLDGSLNGAGASWNLSSQRLAFADEPISDGITITRALADRLELGSSVRLASSSSIDFQTGVSFGTSALESLSLSATSLRNLGSGTDVSFAAHSIVLGGAAASDAQPVPDGAGTLSLNAADIQVGPGTLLVEGFAGSSLSSTGEIRGDGVSALRVAGSLDLTAARITTTSGAKSELASDSAVRIHQASPSNAALPALELGGSLSILGESIDHGGTIVAASGLVSLRAATDLALRASSTVDVAGRAVSAAGRQVGAPGGTISLSAGDGLTADAGSLLSVSGAGDEDAGRIYVDAGGAATLGSTLLGRSANNGGEGSFTLNSGSLANFAALNKQLEDGGFFRERSVHVGAGDLTLSSGDSITARAVKLATDGGTVRVAGSIVAQSDNERGSIDLFGSRGVVLESGALLRAEGLGAQGRGGLVTLGTTTGGSLSLLSGSRISTGGRAADGRVLLRAPALGRDVPGSDTPGVDNDVAISALRSTFAGVSAVVIEPVLSFDAPDSVTNAVFNGYRNQVNTFADTAIPNIAVRLGTAGGLLRVQPGIELLREGDIQIGALDLSNWRFNGGLDPGALTVRASGSINITGNVSDGFTGTNALLNLTTTRSATLRFTAGADLGSVDPGAVIAGALADLSIGTESRAAVVRTGTGDLELGAAHDILFLGPGSGAYTAGLDGVPPESQNVANRQISFATDGGQLSLSAGRDVIVQQPVSEAIGQWQIRGGKSDGTQPTTRWGTRLAQFKWNAGTLGGGDIDIRAGRDVRDLSVAAADSAYERQEGTLTQYRGGVLAIDAGGDISSAYVHATNGVNRLHADGGFTRSRDVADHGLAGSVFSFQDAQIALSARDGIAIETVFHPTMILQPGSPGPQTSYFTTYSEDSAFSAHSVGGDVAIAPDNIRLESFVGANLVAQQGEALWFDVLPPNVSLRSLSSDVSLTGSVGTAGTTILPADHGQFDIFAFRDFAFQGVFWESDAAASTLPIPLIPSATQSVDSERIRTRSARRISDDQPSTITAGRNIVGAGDAGTRIVLASAATIAAGKDILNLSLSGQNLRPGDVTSIAAGRDLRYSGDARSAAIEIGGPGRVDLLAGRDVDFGFSQGISTIGQTLNPQIASKAGADLTVLAGLSQAMDVEKFVDEIVADTQENETRLIAYVEAQSGEHGLTYEAASEKFLALDEQTQRPFVLETFFRELVASGREANADPKLGYSRGYAAIDALFPKSRPTEEDDPPSPYAGDIRLAFSRIYTLAGGNISLVAPGGLLNVGLANPPPSLNLDRKPSELGIVTQGPGDIRVFTNGDVLVNESRLFTLGGGDIAVWSTTGNIDAGRGAKSSVSAPPPRITVDSKGNVVVDFGGAVAGSGIRTIVTAPGVRPGDVDLIAPTGIVNAGDAGIGAAGNINIAAQQVVGLDNIQVGGKSTGVPAETSNLGASLSGVSAVSSSAANAAQSSATDSGRKEGPAPLADTALGWLDVFIEGFGEEVCKPNDAECLNRNRKPQ